MMEMDQALDLEVRQNMRAQLARQLRTGCREEEVSPLVMEFAYVNRDPAAVRAYRAKGA